MAAARRPGGGRAEYLLELHRADGSVDRTLDPLNPVRVGGVFGDKSVVEFPGYEPPRWLGTAAPPGQMTAFAARNGHLGAEVTGSVWVPSGLADGQPAPLLVVHDGPEYDRLADLTRYLAVCIAGEKVPPLRALRLHPGDRNHWYAAHPAYARALHEDVLPAVPGVTRRIGMGTSLGALAMLHAYRHDPSAFDGLFLQSGSFFTERTDPQERRFPQFAEVTRFVGEVHDAGVGGSGLFSLTCGLGEENLACNRLMARTLAALGHRVALHGVRDAHNYTCWRDGLDPHLAALLREALA
ncbi:MAG: alpha/beta hydrolase [Jiangellaceae bacterium]